MTKSSKTELASKKIYNARPENVAKREKNNLARQQALREGRAHIGDHTNVDHIKPLDKGGTNAKSNLRVIDESKNKGWRARQPEMYGKKK